MTLSEKANKTFNLKYKTKEDETWEGACLRVAQHVASAEVDEEKRKEYEQKFFELIYNLVFLPGGRILANAGTNIKNLMNCFCLEIEDSRSSIYQTLKDAAEIFAHGGGVGYNFSNLRHEGAEIKSTGGHASGPLSFMSLFDQTGEVIQQASRRGAQMGILNYDHPDIKKFINYKATPNSRNTRLLEEYKRNLELNGLDKKGTKFFKVLEKTLQDDQLTHFNISVLTNDDFFNNIEKEKNKELLLNISKTAWESGDPGILFYDRTNEDNMTPYLGDLKVTNPCVTGDTRILTVFEGAKTFKELADEGKDVLIYSWNSETKLMEVDRMVSPRKTRANSNLVEVTFDSGLKVRCTPDHNFISFRGRKVSAMGLIPGMSIRAFSMSLHKDGHLRIHGWVNGNARHQYVSRMIYEYIFGKIPDGMILHHKDMDKLNNDPHNFQLLTLSEHTSMHRTNWRKYKNHKVLKIEKLNYKEDVYNGTVEKNSNYIIVDESPVAGICSGIVSSNCGEVALLPYESCCLGSLNLHEFYREEDNSINFEFLEYAVRTAVRFLDNVQDISVAPLPKINKTSKGLRRIGLGIMGWADLLAELELPYDSEDALKLANYLSWFISFFSWLESINLANEKGVFPLYDKEKVNLSVVERILNSKYNPHKVNMDEVRENGLRNVSVTSIAPTGTISILCDCNSGIEPFFALAYIRNITEGVGNTAKDFIIELNPILIKKLKKYNFSNEEIKEITEEVRKTGTLANLEKIPGRIKSLFSNSHEISWASHVEMQAAWQEFITNCVSKTINCPETATPEDIKNAIIYGWNSNLKGMTLYRDKSRTFQVLNVGN